MLNKFYIALVVCIGLLVLCNNMAVVAETQGSDEITVVEMDEVQEKYYNRVFSLSVRPTTSSAYKDRFIYSFDVSEDEKCALFFDNAMVVVMDSDGNVESVLKFNDDLLDVRVPSDVALKWDDGNLKLNQMDNAICTFTTDGKIIDITKIETTRYSLPKTPYKMVNGYEYKIYCNTPFFRYFNGERYNMLLKIKGDSKAVLFESKRVLPETTIFVIVWIILFVAFASFIILLHIPRFRKARDGSSVLKN